MVRGVEALVPYAGVGINRNTNPIKSCVNTASDIYIYIYTHTCMYLR